MKGQSGWASLWKEVGCDIIIDKLQFIHAPSKEENDEKSFQTIYGSFNGLSGCFAGSHCFLLKSSYTNILVPDEKTAISIAMNYPKWKIAPGYADSFNIKAVCKNDEWIVSFTSKYQPKDMLGGDGLVYIINRKTGVVEDFYRMK